MSKADWNTALVATAIAIVVLAGLAATQVTPKRQLLLPLSASLALSSVIYLAVMAGVDVNTGEKGSDFFHQAAVLALATSAVVGVVINQVRRAGQPIAYVLWALLGACLPPIAFFVFLFAMCLDECSLS